VTTAATPTATEVGVGGSGGSSPTELTAGPDANLWITEFSDNRLDEFSVPDGGGTQMPSGPGAVPRGITAGPDGALWYAGAGNKTLGRVTTARSVTEFGSGITAAPFGIAAGPDGNLWFTEPSGKIGRMNTAVDPPAFTSPGAIKVPGTGTSGPASPYPSTINVSGLQGTVLRVRARLNGVHHSRASDLAALLVGPQGQSVLLMSQPNAGPTVGGLPAAGAVMTFADGGATLPGQVVSGIFAPRRFFDDPAFPAPAPAGPYTTGLSSLAGTDPNGTWQLFVTDLASNETGVI